jgi:hypothetical protein
MLGEVEEPLVEDPLCAKVNGATAKANATVRIVFFISVAPDTIMRAERLDAA